MLISVIVAAVLAAVDQITKHIALTKLKPIGNTTFIKGFMDFTFVENRGAAFGMLSGARWFFVIITIIVTAAILIYIKKYMPKTKEYRLVKVALTLILAGAWGNVIDRMFRGYVVDYFETVFIRWPVFNVADIYVVVGTIILAYAFIFVIKDEPKK